MREVGNVTADREASVVDSEADGDDAAQGALEQDTLETDAMSDMALLVSGMLEKGGEADRQLAKEIETAEAKLEGTYQQIEAYFGDEIFYYRGYQGTALQVAQVCPAAGLVAARGFDAFRDWLEANRMEAPTDEDEPSKDEGAVEEENSDDKNTIINERPMKNAPEVQETKISPTLVVKESVPVVAVGAVEDAPKGATPHSAVTARQAEGALPEAVAAPTTERGSASEEVSLGPVAEPVFEPAPVSDFEGAPVSASDGNPVSVAESVPEVEPDSKPEPELATTLAGIVTSDQQREAVGAQESEQVSDKVDIAAADSPLVVEDTLDSAGDRESILERQLDEAYVGDDEDEFESDTDTDTDNELLGDVNIDSSATEMAVYTAESSEASDSPDLFEASDAVFTLVENWHALAREDPPLDELFIVMTETLDGLQEDATEPVADMDMDVEMEMGTPDQQLSSVYADEAVAVSFAELTTMEDAAELSGAITALDAFDETIIAEARPELVTVFVAVRAARKAIDQLHGAKTKAECATSLSALQAELIVMLRALGYNDPESAVRTFLTTHSPTALRSLIVELEKALRHSLYYELLIRDAHHAHARHARLNKFIAFIMGTVTGRKETTLVTA